MDTIMLRWVRFMFRGRTGVALCIFGFCLAAANVALAAQKGDADEFVKPQPKKKPGLVDQFGQAVRKAFATANPTLKLKVPNSAPLTNQQINVEAEWSLPVRNASYRFDWGDKGTSEVQSALSTQGHSYENPGTYLVTVVGAGTFDGGPVNVPSYATIVVSLAPEVNSQPSNAGDLPASPHTPVQKPVRPTAIKLLPTPTSAVEGSPVQFRVAVDPPARFDNFHYYFGDKSDTVAGNGIKHRYTWADTFPAYVTAESASAGVFLKSAPVQVRIRRADARPVLTLVATTAAPIAGRELGVFAELDPAENSVSYRFNWGDGSPVDISGVDSLGDGRHTYSSSGTYLVRVTAHIVRDGTPLTITCKPLRLTVAAAPPPWALIALIVASLPILIGLSYAFRPKVSCVYGSTRWDSPRFSAVATHGAEASYGVVATHIVVSFRPGDRPAQHSIRILK